MTASPSIPEPGEPEIPEAEVTHRRDEIDHDDLIGFASPAALQGRVREPAPPVDEQVFDPVVAPLFEEPVHEASVVEEAALQPVAPIPPVVAPPFAPAPVLPDWARETPPAEQPATGFARRREQPAPIESAMSLYTVYALILFAVPTLGVSAVIALFAVFGRATPNDAVAASHFLFQKRTLWIGGAVALIGGVLIAVGLGVFVLFLLAVWLIVRGAGGVLKLKAGRPIDNPGTLLL